MVNPSRGQQKPSFLPKDTDADKQAGTENDNGGKCPRRKEEEKWAHRLREEAQEGFPTANAVNTPPPPPPFREEPQRSLTCQYPPPPE